MHWLQKANEAQSQENIEKKVHDILLEEQASISEVFCISLNLLLDILVNVLRNDGEECSNKIFDEFIEHASDYYKDEVLDAACKKACKQ